MSSAQHENVFPSIGFGQFFRMYSHPDARDEPVEGQWESGSDPHEYPSGEEPAG